MTAPGLWERWVRKWTRLALCLPGTICSRPKKMVFSFSGAQYPTVSGLWPLVCLLLVSATRGRLLPLLAVQSLLLQPGGSLVMFQCLEEGLPHALQHSSEHTPHPVG